MTDPEATEEIVLRETELEDAATLCDLIGEVARERRFLASVEGFGFHATQAFIQAILDSSGVHLVASANGRLVGWCDIAPGPFEGLRHCGRLGMGCHRDYRHQGIGRRLVQEAVRLAFHRGMSRIELEVFASNSVAIALYASEGFVQEGRKRRARILDGVSEDILVMGKLFPEG